MNTQRYVHIVVVNDTGKDIEGKLQMTFISKKDDDYHYSGLYVKENKDNYLSGIGFSAEKRTMNKAYEIDLKIILEKQNITIKHVFDVKYFWYIPKYRYTFTIDKDNKITCKELEYIRLCRELKANVDASAIKVVDRSP